jgi:anti-sigma regulatory factor (Ser/Thr protein kinase)
VSRTRRRPSVILAVPSRTEFLAVVRDVARRMAETAGFDPAVAEQVALAVDEAATNVIEHAYAGAPDRVVELRCEDRGRELQFDVIDNGRGVDPRAVPRVDLEKYVTERRKGGLGVHLMGKIMDSVTFRRSSRRNVCRMVKRRPKETVRGGGEE